MLTVNAQEATRLSVLLRLVEERDERIRVFQNGRRSSRLLPNPRLAGVTFHEDPVAPLTDDDWPDT